MNQFKKVKIKQIRLVEAINTNKLELMRISKILFSAIFFIKSFSFIHTLYTSNQNITSLLNIFLLSKLTLYTR